MKQEATEVARVDRRSGAVGISGIYAGEHVKVGSLNGNSRVLTATKPRFSEYLKAWYVDYTEYVEPGPCPCCGQPRGAGSLHP